MKLDNKKIGIAALVGVGAYLLYKQFNNTTTNYTGKVGKRYRGIGALYNPQQYTICLANNPISATDIDTKIKCCGEAFGFWNGVDCVDPQATTPQILCTNSGGFWDSTTSTCTCPPDRFLTGGVCTGCIGNTILGPNSQCIPCGDNSTAVNNACVCNAGYIADPTTSDNIIPTCVPDTSTETPTCSQNQILVNGVCTPIDIAANIVTGYPPVMYGGGGGGGTDTTVIDTPTEPISIMDYIPLILGGMTVALAVVSEE